MKTSIFVESNAIPSFATVSATIQCANLALFKAVAATMWANRAHATPEGRVAEVVDYFGISAIPSTSGYEELQRSPASKWTEAWTHLVEVAMASARAAECGKALEKLMTPGQVAAKFGNTEPAAIDPGLIPGLDASLLAALAKGSAADAARVNARDQADAADAAREVDLTFRQLRGNAEIDLFPHEVEQLVSRFATQLRDGLVFGLSRGYYSRKGAVDPRRAGELAIEADVLKVAELTLEYLVTVGCADDTEDMDASNANR